MPDKKLPSVPETILKRRKRQAAARAERQKAALDESAARKKKRADIFKRAEKYAKEYRQVSANKEEIVNDNRGDLWHSDCRLVVSHFEKTQSRSTKKNLNSSIFFSINSSK